MSVAMIAVAGTVVAAGVSASASKSAAKGQANAAREASQTQAESLDRQTDLQREQFEYARGVQQPIIDAGNLARNRLLFGMGLSPTGTSQPATQTLTRGADGSYSPATAAAPTREQIRQELLSQYTTTNTPGIPEGAIRDGEGYYMVGGTSQDPTHTYTLGPSPTSTVDEAGLTAAIDARMAQTGKQAPMESRADPNDPNYGNLLRNFGANDLATDPLYEGGLVAQARARASDPIKNDPFYERDMVAAARNRVLDPSSDPLTARMRPAVNAALAGSVSINDDPLYRQQQGLVDQAIQRASNFETAPGYTFRLGEGQKAVEQGAAARSGLYSGAAAKELLRYGQGFASNEYANWHAQSDRDRGYVSAVGNDATNRLISNRNFVSGQNDAQYGRMNTDRNFVQGQNDGAYSRAATDRNYIASQGDSSYNRFSTNQTNQFNRLSAVAGSGQTAGNNVQTAGQNYAQGAGTAYGNYANAVNGINMSNANAQGAAGIAGANAIGGGINAAINGYQQNQAIQNQQQNQNRFLTLLQNGQGGGGVYSPTYNFATQGYGDRY